MPAASVPATTTVCRSRAATIWPAQVVWRRALCFFSLASILALPTRFSSAGVGQATTGLQDGVVPRPGPQDGLQGGVDLGVQAPDAALGLVDLLGQVQVEPGRHAQRRRVLVVGVDGSQGAGASRAAWAITAASRASVLALPGVRSAMRLMDSPGR